ncbi:MAG: response regulator [Acidobacteriaceae bacterium]
MSEKILFVDDEASVLAALRRILHASFEVRTASSGGEGLLMLDRDGPFAVVISDMQMPGMNGAEFLSRVRQRAPCTVRMLLTGHADLHNAIDAVNRGQILHFLTKPCPANVLIAAINSGLDQYHAAVEQRELSREARAMQRRQIDWSAAAPAGWEQFRSPVGLPGPAEAKTCLEPLIGKDAETYTVLLRLPVLDTVEQRYGQSATAAYLSTVAGYLQNSLAAGDRLFHWRRDILLAVLRRHISPAAVGKELERLIADTRGYIIEVQGKPTMVACLITLDLLAGTQFSGFPEWLAAFEARCDGVATASVGAP